MPTSGNLLIAVPKGLRWLECNILDFKLLQCYSVGRLVVEISPSLEPPLEPSLRNGSALPSPLIEASASPEEVSMAKKVAAMVMGAVDSLKHGKPLISPESHAPPKADLLPPPSSALPPPPGSDLDRALQKFKEARNQKEKRE